MRISRRFKRIVSAMLATALAFTMTFSTDVMPLADSKQDQLKAMMRALDKAVAYCTSDLDGTVALTEKYVPALSDDAQRAAARATLEATNKLYGSQLGKQDAQRWSDMATFMAESGIISKPVDAKESFVSLVG